MPHRNSVALRVQSDLDFLLNAGCRLGGLNEFQNGAIPLMLDWPVVRGITAGFDLRRVPKTVSAVIAPDIAPRLADVGKFLEEIGAAHKAKPDDARPDIRGRD